MSDSDDEKAYIGLADHLKNIFAEGDPRALTRVIMNELERCAAVEILAEDAGVNVDDDAVKELYSRRWDEVRERVSELTNFIIGEIVSRSEA